MKSHYPVSLLLSLSLFSIKSPAIAQITPDTSLGPESAYVVPINQLLQLIQGGAMRGENLFQSFQDFNIKDGQTIVLTNPNGVNHILIRVTGNNPSEILGNLSLIKADTINNLLINLPNLSLSPNTNLSSFIQPQDLGTASLFFLNPNGILFGPNARLNVGGSFLATTANQIKLEDGTVFSANVDQSSPLLTISTPIGLEFTSDSPQPITVKGPDQSLTNVLQNLPLFQSFASLSEILDVVQTSIGGILDRPVGLRVFPSETIALVGGNVSLDSGNLTALGGRIEVGSVMDRGNVSLTPVVDGWKLGYEGIDFSSQGTIALSQLALLNSSGLGGGEIQLRGQNIALSNESAILSLTLSNEDEGDINIQGQNVSLSNGSIIGTGTFIDTFGNSGSVMIKTKDLTVQGSSVIQTTTVGEGKGGDLIINAQNSVNLLDKSLAATGSLGGEGGEFRIETSRLSLSDGSVISASTLSPNNAGDIVINVSDVLSLDRNSEITAGTNAEGNAGNIRLNVGNELLMNNNSQISTTALGNATGGGGLIDINANSLQMKNQSGIRVFSEGSSDSGNINLNITGLFSATDSNITANANQGAGGEITMSAGAFRLQGDSDIRTNVDDGTGTAQGGNITLNANYILLFNDSDILAFARQGRGGNIELNTSVFFGDGYQPISDTIDPDTLDGNERVDINASGVVSGAIIIPDLTFMQNSIVQLPQFLINPEKILANSCISPDQNRSGSFIITGSGGIPSRPGDLNVPSYFPETIKPLPETPSQPWQEGDPIIEPQGVYKTPDGRIFLSREC